LIRQNLTTIAVLVKRMFRKIASIANNAKGLNW